MDRFEAQSELAFIKKAIEDSRRVTFDYGIILVVWGIISVLGFCGNFGILFFIEKSEIPIGNELDLFFWLWIGLFIVGIILTLSVLRMKLKAIESLTFVGRIILSTWASCGIAILLISFMGSKTGAIQTWAISPINSTIFGAGFFICGIISNQKWCRNLSFGWWAGALAMLWIGDTDIHWDFIIMPLLIFFLLLVPGLILYVKEKRSV